MGNQQIITRKRHSTTEFQVNNFDVATKRARYDVNTSAPSLVQTSDSGYSPSVNGGSPGVPSLNSDLNPVEQMIGALIAEGDRGAESQKILISNIRPEILADIVITNMKHLPKSPPPLTRLGSLSKTRQNGSPSGAFQVPNIDTSVPKTQSAHMPFSSPNTNNSSLSEVSAPVLQYLHLKSYAQDIEDDDQQITLPCKHIYHAGCGSKWLSINKACPICYKKVFANAPKQSVK